MTFLSSLLWLAAAAAVPAAPPAAKKPVTDTVQGVQITDEYRWLEDAESPDVKTFIDAQNAYARSVLDATPHVEDIRRRVKELESGGSADWTELDAEGGKLFAIEHRPAKQQPFLVVMGTTADPKAEKVLVDPNKIDPKGNTAIDWYVPTTDGKKVAVSLSLDGTEAGDVHVFDVATGKDSGEIVPRVNGGTAGGSLAWKHDASGFWYTRYPRGSERPTEDMGFWTQVFFHKVGTKTEDDVLAIGKDFPRIAEIQLAASGDGKWVLATVANGDGGEFAHYVAAQDGGEWRQVTKFEDRAVQGRLGSDGNLYLLSRKDAPKGRILRLPLEGGTLDAATVVVPEGDGAIEGFLPCADRMYVDYLMGGPSELKTYDLRGNPHETVPILAISSVAGMVKLDGNRILYRNETFLTPPAWYEFGGKTAGSHKTKLATTSSVDYSDVEVVREFATAADGAKIPINILRRKGTKLDGTNPTVLYAYGGYGVSLEPSFNAAPRLRKMWLEQGGVWAIANLRGGGEFGDAWHSAARLTTKQVAFDDFWACAQYLVKNGYTSPQKLAAYGRSNGGLLMGATITQHPEGFKAIAANVGIYDSLRFELEPNGAFNVTEFGSVKDPAQFKALYAYSPYHHVKDGTAYPAMLLTTGIHDPRVGPYQSRKMAARLQAATSSGNPILLRTTSGGHGGGGSGSLDQRVEQDVDLFAFLFGQLGVDYKPVSSKKS
jgi:prolyl oligopeptidase